jgi:molybdate transport system substrate-binding protein
MRLAAWALVLAGCGGAEAPVRVLAASSLEETLTEAAAEWTKRGGRPVSLSFAASSTLARQIADGAGADVFISADAAWADAVKPAERFEWVGNRLVIVGDGDLTGTVAMAGEEVPAGKLAAAALKRLGVTPTRIVYGANVRDVLAKVREGAASSGFVYATDAPGRELEERTRYVVARLTPAGAAFASALREPWAVAMATKRGFAS